MPQSPREHFLADGRSLGDCPHSTRSKHPTLALIPALWYTPFMRIIRTVIVAGVAGTIGYLAGASGIIVNAAPVEREQTCIVTFEAPGAWLRDARINPTGDRGRELANLRAEAEHDGCTVIVKKGPSDSQATVTYTLKGTL